jgi:hypothetical protein
VRCAALPGAPEDFVRLVDAVEVHGGHLAGGERAAAARRVSREAAPRASLRVRADNAACAAVARAPRLAQRRRGVLVRVHRLRERAVRALDVVVRGVARDCGRGGRKRSCASAMPRMQESANRAREHSLRNAPASTAYRSGSLPRCGASSSSASASAMAGARREAAGRRGGRHPRALRTRTAHARRGARKARLAGRILPAVLI